MSRSHMPAPLQGCCSLHSLLMFQVLVRVLVLPACSTACGQASPTKYMARTVYTVKRFAAYVFSNGISRL
jgi:hypothetical protein